jgi:hypothetical protein
VDGIAELPASDWAAALRPVAAKAINALAARRDGPDQHTIAHTIASQTLAEFVNHTDRLVPYYKTRANLVFSLQDVDVGATNRCQRNADNSFPNARPGNRY